MNGSVSYFVIYWIWFFFVDYNDLIFIFFIIIIVFVNEEMLIDSINIKIVVKKEVLIEEKIEFCCLLVVVRFLFCGFLFLCFKEVGWLIYY